MKFTSFLIWVCSESVKVSPFFVNRSRDQVGMKRREVVLQIASSVFFLPLAVSPSFAETSIADSKFVLMFDSLRIWKPNQNLSLIPDASETFRVYTDEVNKFEISIPQGNLIKLCC